MSTTPNDDVLSGHITDIDEAAGLFYAWLDMSTDNDLTDVIEIETPINELSPLELPYLQKGALFKLYLHQKKGRRFVFSRETWKQEDLDRVKQQAEEMMSLLDEHNLQFPLLGRQIGKTSDSMSYQRAAPGAIEIPLGQHVGAFGVVRRHHVHEGVDLYASEGTTVVTMEEGVVVYIGPFTGPKAGSPHWNDTDMVMVEGASGVIGYGEITPLRGLKVGDQVIARQEIGKIATVLKVDKGRPMAMLHLELYKHGVHKHIDEWPLHTAQPEQLLDPTPLLLRAAGYPPGQSGV